jgi:hypothetical protein
MINNDETFIQQIKLRLDEHQLDADTRLALQQARVKAMSAGSRRRWRMPWLEFAVTASLLTVLALNLPVTKPAKTPEKIEPSTAKSVQPRRTATAATASKTPAKTPAAKPTNQSTADAELLENLELYEDAEFYQWLSEQPHQGAQDA